MKNSILLNGKIPFLIWGSVFFLLSVGSAYSQTISGTVRSGTDNQLMPGVTLNVKGTTKGTVTDGSGRYRLEGVSPTDTIVFSFIGYNSSVQLVRSRREIDVRLEPSTASLNQVVVIGYGTQKKRDLTGSVSSVNAGKLADEHPKGLQDILRGNAAGLNVGFSASAEGGGSLEVRGRKSLNAGGTPLLVVDGVIYYGNLSDINPYDIANVDILKDASAAAVYGAKAANGVIIITTKKGVEGKPRINFNATYGLATMEVNQPVYSAQGYIKWRGDVMTATHENSQPYQYADPRKLPSNISTDQWLAYDNSSGDPVTVWLQRLNFQPIEISNYKAGKSIDWYDKVFHTGLQQDYNVSISDKKKDMSYYWSLGYEDNDGIIVGDGFKTVRSRLNLQSQITKFLEVGLNTQFSIRDESQIPVSWSQMLNDSPWGSMYEDDGVTLRLSPQDQSAISSNPFLVDYEYRLQKYYNLTSSLFAKLTLPFGITYQLNFSPDVYWHNYYNHESTQNATWALQGGIATRTQDQEYRWQLDNLITWNRTFNKIHQVTLTLLANAEKDQTWANTMTNNGFSPSDALGYHNIGIGDNPVISSNDTYSTGDALMARLFYSLKDRYMLTASVRRDGYSAFGQRHPRATFPSLALGWVFTDEKFFNAPWLSYGKVRLSYGINGNRDVGEYTALSQVSSGTYEHVNSSGTVIPVTTLRVSTMSNPDLKWEKTAAYNLGFDFTIKGNIVNGSIDAYRMATTDLLVKRTLSSVVGFSYVMANLGEVQNKGIELTLNSTNVNKENFSWHSTLTFSLNRNKIVHLYGDMEDVVDANGKVVGRKEMDDVTNKWFIGHAIDAIWDLKEVGVYQTSEKADAEKYGVEPGDFKLQDVNNDGQLTDADRQFLGFTTPRYRWSLRNDFDIFKNFNLSFLIYSYWGQKGVFDEAKNSGVTRYLDRQSAYALPYWTPDNPINDFAKLSSSNGSTTYDVYRSKSFIRLSTVALSYSLPQSLIRRFKMQDMKVFFNVKDAYFYSPGEFLWDPENAGPTPRTFSMGINLTL